MQDFQMTTGEKVKIGVTVFDQGKPPVQYQGELPDGTEIIFESDNPDVAPIEPIEGDPYHVYVRSTTTGQALITVRGTGELASVPVDQGLCTVTNAAPGSFNTTVGAPEAEE